ncbi:hypothetical protein ABKV19_018154 [Rosa sericea]
MKNSSNINLSVHSFRYPRFNHCKWPSGSCLVGYAPQPRFELRSCQSGQALCCNAQLEHFTCAEGISQVHTFLSDFVLTTIVIPKFGGPPVQSHWSRPCLPFLKLNVDGAVDDLIGRRGLGAVLRSENGELMLAASKGLMGGFCAKATELYVAALRLRTISQAGFQNSQIIFEMDALLAVNDLKEEEPNWSIEGALIEEVKAMLHLYLPLSNVYILP